MPYYYVATKKVKNVTNCETYFFLLASNQNDITITTEKVLEERKSVHLIWKSSKNFRAESFQQV